MKIEEYINQLRTYLYGMPENDMNEALEYYTEYLSEVSDENLDEEIKKLGNPEFLAKQLKSEVPNNTQMNFSDKNKNSNSALKITVLILTSPIWLSLLAAYFSIYVTIICVIFSVYIAFPAMALTFLICAFGTAKYSVYDVIFFAGGFLITLGASLMLFKPALNGIVESSKLFAKSLVKMYRFIFPKKN